MSIKIMTHVWDHSAQTGTALLMMLALADHANDEGMCWPSIETLACKCRCSARQAQRILRDLETQGEIRSELGSGRTHTTLYFLPTGAKKGDIQREKGDTGDTLSGAKKGDIQGKKGDIQRERVTSSALKGDIAVSPEPFNQLTTSSSTASRDPSVPLASEAAESQCDPELGAAYRLFENEIGLISGSIAPDMADMFDCLRANGRAKWWELAIKQAAGNNKRTWNYVRATLQNCEREGRPPGVAPPARVGRAPANGNGKERAAKAVDVFEQALEIRRRQRGEID